MTHAPSTSHPLMASDGPDAPSGATDSTPTPQSKVIMFSIMESETRIEFTLSADRTLVDRVITSSLAFLGLQAKGETIVLRRVLRELLNDTIEHGNGTGPAKQIYCSLSLLPGERVLVTVRDTGADSTPPELPPHAGAGQNQARIQRLPIVRVYADQLTTNEAGDEISIQLTIPRDVSLAVNRDGGKLTVITPGGALTATGAESLRLLLLDLLREGSTAFQLDFRHVSDLDPTVLSVLILFAQKLADSPGASRCQIVNTKPDIAGLFRLSRLDQLFELH